MIRYLLPLGVFVLLLVVLAIGLSLDPREVPSPLINKPAPEFQLPALSEVSQTVSLATLQQHSVSLLNVWASWCVACRQEHEVLLAVSKQTDIPIFGLNYKDQPEEARAWLDELGDPYVASAVDADGRVGRDWGVYGVPETFLVDAQGVIRYKHIGPVTYEWIETELLPRVAGLRKGE